MKKLFINNSSTYKAKSTKATGVNVAKGISFADVLGKIKR